MWLGKVVKEPKVEAAGGADRADRMRLPGNVVAVGLKAGPLSQWLHLHLSDAASPVVLETRRSRAP